MSLPPSISLPDDEARDDESAACRSPVSAPDIQVHEERLAAEMEERLAAEMGADMDALMGGGVGFDVSDDEEDGGGMQVTPPLPTPAPAPAPAVDVEVVAAPPKKLSKLAMKKQMLAFGGEPEPEPTTAVDFRTKLGNRKMALKLSMPGMPTGGVGGLAMPAYEQEPSFDITASPGGTAAFVSLRHGVRLSEKGEASSTVSSAGSWNGLQSSRSNKSLPSQGSASSVCSDGPLSGGSVFSTLDGPPSATGSSGRGNGGMDLPRVGEGAAPPPDAGSPLASAPGDSPQLRMRDLQRCTPRRLLGEGTFGAVEYAVHAPTCTPVALKFMKVEANKGHRDSIIRCAPPPLRAVWSADSWRLRLCLLRVKGVGASGGDDGASKYRSVPRYLLLRG
jgi:hypothetical protein